MIFIIEKYALEQLISLLNSDTIDLSYFSRLFVDTKFIFYGRILVYLPIWIIAFRFTFKFLKINDILLRLISFNLILMLFKSFSIPITVAYFFTPPFYYLVASILITPIIIYTIPYYRNFLKSMIEQQSRIKE
ncbi:MAG: hypothetical protein ACE364_05375 [Chlorobiota bacterium]